MSQQQWGGQPGRNPNQAAGGGYAPPAYGQSRWPQYGPSGSTGQYLAHPQPGGYSAPSGYGGGPGIPQYGPPPGQFRPPRRSSPIKAVLLALVAVAALALAGLVVASLTTETSEAAYQNDDYQVPPPDKNPPPLPQPQTYGEAEDWLTDSAFYGQTVPAPVRCTAQPINVAEADDEQLETHFTALMECMTRVWEPPVTAADFIIVRPSVTVYGSEITTRCGKTGVNAFYCSADQQIYFSNLLAQAVPIVAVDKWAADVVMAHEFGHALQGRTGLLISAQALAATADSKPVANQILRRLEVQADCFSGMFLRSVSTSLGIQQSDLRGILATYAAVGDDTLTGDTAVDGNHGLARSREYWGSTGLGSSSVEACNTFTAEARLVR